MNSVTVYPASMIVPNVELKNEKSQCHYCAAFNAATLDAQYVEGYVDESDIPHAINRLQDGTYVDALATIPYSFTPVKEYSAVDILTIHRMIGQSFLTIGNEKRHL